MNILSSRRKHPLILAGVLVLILLGCRLPVAPDVLPVEPSPTPEPAQLQIPTLDPVPATLLAPTLTPTPNTRGDFRSLMQLAGAPQGSLADEWASQDGTLWVTSEKGIYQFQARGWKLVLEGNAGRILGPDGAGRLWVLMDNASRIAAVTSQKTTIYDSQKGWVALPQVDAFLRGFGKRMATDGKGQVWVATEQDDLRRYDPKTDRWEKFTSTQIGLNPAVSLDMDLNLITNVLLAKDGSVWVGSCSTGVNSVAGQGVRVFDGQAWHPVVETSDQCVFDMDMDSAGNIWVGGFNQLLFYNTATKNWKNIPLPPFERRQLVFSVDVDAAQRPWVEVGLGGGASLWGATDRYHLEGTQWVQDLSSAGLVLSDVAFSAEGDAWLCADGGVNHYKDNKMQQAVQLDTYDCKAAAGPHGQVYIIARDGKDAGIWQLVK